MIEYNKPWEHFLTRQFTLFEVSLWHKWYNSVLIKSELGVSLPDALFIEESGNIIRRYVVREDLSKFKDAIRKFIVNNQHKCEELLKKGFEMNKKADLMLKNKINVNFNDAVEFFLSMQLYTTLLPYFVYGTLDELNIKNQILLKMAGRLRVVSYFPRFMRDVLSPCAKEEFRTDVGLMTISEVLEGKFYVVKDRVRIRNLNKFFIYQVYKGKETIEFNDNPIKIISKIENMKLSDTIKGSVAYPGKAKGKVRIVSGYNPYINFDKGDILVSACTNPQLTPLFHKCAAVVTDEGGIMSHAAILSREMKKPCIIGTKHATKIFKDNDLVEVDAVSGIVRKVND